MSNVYRLDDLRKKADDQFGNFELEIDDDTKMVLLNPLRVSEERRDKITKHFESLGGQDAEVNEDDLEKSIDEDGTTFFDVIKAILRLVAAEEAEGEYLVETIGEDKPLLLVVFNAWTEATQAGEA